MLVQNSAKKWEDNAFIIIIIILCVCVCEESGIKLMVCHKVQQTPQ